MENKKSLGKFVSIIYRYNQIYLANHLKKYNIGAAQIPVLKVISCNEGINQDDVTKALIIDKGAVAKSIKKLLDAGYIKKEKDESDKRAYKLYLTQKYISIQKEVECILNDLTNELTKDLDKNEKEYLFNTLDKIAVKAVTMIQGDKNEG